jgi:nucleoside-diphosphate-sugar epimerase
VCGARKLLFVSSGAVYGRQPPHLTHVCEDYSGAPDPLDPNSAYGEGKRAAELLCAIAAKKHGFEIKVARCFAFVGPHLPLDAHFAIGNFIRDAMQGGPIHVGGDGTPFRSYLYASDLAIWLWTILFRGASGRPYNVGSPHHLTIREAAETTSIASGLAKQIHVAKTPAPGQSVSRYVPDVQRATSELGLEAQINLMSGVQKTVRWAQSGIRQIVQ